MIEKDFLDEKLRNLGPALLKPEYQKIWTPERPTTGYCYVVSEALYHYQVEDSASYVIRLGEYGTHWFLRDADLNVIDMTGDQFDFEVPYAKARRATFFKGRVKTPRGTISTNGFLMAKYLRVV